MIRKIKNVSGFIIILIISYISCFLLLVVFDCIYQTYWGEISQTDYQKIKECVRSALEDDNKIDQLEFMQIKDLIKKYQKYQKKHLVERLRTLVNHPEKEEGAYGKGDQT